MQDDDSLLPDSTDVILFMFFGLALGIIIMQILSKLGDPVPYTVVIFVLGVLFSLNNELGTGNDSMWSDSIKKWSKIDAELMLFVFLPPLIFGEAMSLNWFFVVGGFVQSLILAGPGVLIGAALMALFSRVVIPHNWSWLLCFVFGSILSATDPVAVVALLKEAGASPKLTILIVGESLLNDGTAMVLFTLFFNMLNGEHYTAGKIIAFFFEACLGSPVFGIISGLLIVRWLRSCNRSLKEIDTVVQICITICGAYLIFFVAQNPMEVSGVLACCGAGAMMSWLAPPLILNHESMHNVWCIIEWMCNTLIFLLAGLIIGTRTLRQVDLLDWGIMILLYIALMVIRVIVIAGLFPWLSGIGHKCTRKEAVFMAHAGLRGALSMALALIVEKHRDESDDKDQAPRLFFYVGGIAALTLIINATTAQWLLLKLGLMGEQSVEQDMVVTQIRKRLQKKINKAISDMQNDMDPEIVEEIRQSCSLMRNSDNMDWNQTRESEVDSIMEAALSGTDNGSGIMKREGSFASRSHSISRNSRSGSMSVMRTKSADAREKRWGSRAMSMAQAIARSRSKSSAGQLEGVAEIVAYVRTVFLEIVRVGYWHDIETGKLPRLSHSAQFLLYSIDVGLDQVRSPHCLQDWACVEAELDYEPILIRVLSSCEKYAPFSMLSRIVGRLEARREKRAVYILTSFIDAHKRAQVKMHSYVSDTDYDDEPTAEEIKVRNESIALVEVAERRLKAMNRETVSAIRSKQAARMLLSRQADMVKGMVKEGLLTSKHAEEFLDEISEDTSRIEKERNRMYREHAQKNALRRVQLNDDMRSSTLGRDSMFGKYLEPVPEIATEDVQESVTSPLINVNNSN